MTRKQKILWATAILSILLVFGFIWASTLSHVTIIVRKPFVARLKNGFWIKSSDADGVDYYEAYYWGQRANVNVSLNGKESIYLVNRASADSGYYVPPSSSRQWQDYCAAR